LKICVVGFLKHYIWNESLSKKQEIDGTLRIPLQPSNG
jgi:hypothetical protein